MSIYKLLTCSSKPFSFLPFSVKATSKSKRCETSSECSLIKEKNVGLSNFNLSYCPLNMQVRNEKAAQRMSALRSENKSSIRLYNLAIDP